MGAQEFECTGKGTTAQEAFNNATDMARFDYGNSGYTGSIAEKTSFKMITCPEDNDAVNAKVDEVMNDENHWIQNKWGPSGCIKVGESTYLFFGWASS